MVHIDELGCHCQQFLLEILQIYKKAVTVLRISNQGYFSKKLSHKHLQDAFESWRMLIKAKSLVRLQRHFSRTLKQNKGTDISVISHPDVFCPIGTKPVMLCLHKDLDDKALLLP